MAERPRMGDGVEPLGGRMGLTGKGFEGTVGRKLDKEVREGTLRRQGVRMKGLGSGRLQSGSAELSVQ